MNNERLWYTVAQRAAIVCVAAAVAACGPGGGGGGGEGPATLSPTTADVPVGGRTAFTLSPAQAADWTVNDLVGGTATVGRISAIGVYTAPFVIPSPTTVTIGASVATNTATVKVVSRFIDDGPVTIGTCPSPLSACINALAVPDLNGDGLSDLVTANTASGTFSVVLRASASSFFASAPPYDVGSPDASEPQALAIADLDGDLTLDVAVADAGSTSRAVRSRLGSGTGAFGNEVETVLANASAPLSLAVGHFDTVSDPTVRIPDVAVARFENGTDPSELIILRGDGTGHFLPSQLITVGISQPLSVIVADFNNDQLDDLAVANSGGLEGNTVSVFFGVGDGTFQAAESYPVAGGPSAVVAVDLNGDPFLDLAVTAAVDNTLTFILNKGASGAPGAHFQVPSQPYATGAGPIALTAADVNGDQFQDLVVVNRDADTVMVFLGYGDGTAVASETYPVGHAPQSVAVGDFNGDDRPDLAVANSGDDTVTILRNRGS